MLTASDGTDAGITDERLTGGAVAQLLVDRSEFLVYRLLRNGLEAADSFCHDMKAAATAQNDYLQAEALDLRTV
ncbi:MAG: hypothetical protein ACOC8X_03800, partial [Chloroflexota bacterium]